MGNRPDLASTADMMLSDDYKERFKADYYQLVIRCDKLYTMLEKWRNGTLEFTPTCPYDTLHTQLVHMEAYRNVLEQRAILEGIQL